MDWFPSLSSWTVEISLHKVYIWSIYIFYSELLARRGSFTSCEAFIIPTHSFSFCMKCVTDPVVVFYVVVESVKLNYLQSLVLVCTYCMAWDRIHLLYILFGNLVSYRLFGNLNFHTACLEIKTCPLTLFACMPQGEKWNFPSALWTWNLTFYWQFSTNPVEDRAKCRMYKTFGSILYRIGEKQSIKCQISCPPDRWEISFFAMCLSLGLGSFNCVLLSGFCCLRS